MGECEGQLNLVCDSCEGERIIRSSDTPAEVCSDCDGTGIDPDAVFYSVVVRGVFRGLVAKRGDAHTSLVPAIDPSGDGGHELPSQRG